jgi:WD40 repeat protein
MDVILAQHCLSDAFTSCMAFSADGEHIIVGAEDSRLRLVESASNTATSEITLPAIPRIVSWSQFQDTVIVLCDDRVPRLMNLSTQSIASELQLFNNVQQQDIALCPYDATQAATLGVDNNVYLWDIAVGICHSVLVTDEKVLRANTLVPEHYGWFINTLCWHPTKAKLLLAGNNSLAWIWPVQV